MEYSVEQMAQFKIDLMNMDLAACVEKYGSDYAKMLYQLSKELK